jgi:hypothetical protein
MVDRICAKSAMSRQAIGTARIASELRRPLLRRLCDKTLQRFSRGGPRNECPLALPTRTEIAQNDHQSIREVT